MGPVGNDLREAGWRVNWVAIWVTCKLAGLTALALLCIGLPIAYWLRFPVGDGNFVESVVALPLVLPPTVLVLHSYRHRPHSPFGRLYTNVVGHPLPFTFEGLLLASILYSLPFAVQPFAAAFDQVDRRVIEASWTLGASKLKTFFKLIVPLSTAGLVTGAVLKFRPYDGEFGVVLMIGGNLEGSTRTVSIDIYDEVQALNYVGAAQTALFLLVVSYAVLAGVYALNRNVGSMAAEIGIHPGKTFPGVRRSGGDSVSREGRRS